MKQILEKQQEKTLNEVKLKNLENGKFKSGRNWENKGTRDNPSGNMFHNDDKKEEKRSKGMKR